jgi:hypothetical protein
MKARRFIKGALLGASFYLVCLGGHTLWAGGLRPYPGCMPEPMLYVINVPSWLVGAVIKNRVVAAQQIGKPKGEDLDRAEAQWSPVGFVALGLFFYMLLGSAGYGLLTTKPADVAGKS